MDLRSVECFVAVADLLHFGRAASSLHLSQPALSGRIRSLETEVGVRLLDRDRRSVALTEAGRAFLPAARETLAAAHAASTAARRTARGESGQLRLGFTVIAFHTSLPRGVQQYRAQYPDVVVDLVERNSPALEEALVSGEIDLAILHPPLRQPGLVVQELPAEQLVLAFPETHPLADRAVLTFADLDREPLLAAPRAIGPALYDRLMAAFAQAGAVAQVVQEVTPMTTLTGLVAAGSGIGFVTQGIANARRPGVTFTAVRGAPDLPLAAAWLSPDPLPSANNFLAIARRVLTDRSAEASASRA
ncbi:LysR family transcriptional regulator [Actinopolymorpha sp. B9G3]|uniref:LysR family transcriptional regulator n=1 Tax=Actinopolymorpha sp. B9G3 TaxID=3158970 RepID=UPI0032D961D7